VLREGQTFRDLYEERTKLFEQYADLTICEDGCQIEETIDAVLTQIEALEKK
jgi:shikimate kinase